MHGCMWQGLYDGSPSVHQTFSPQRAEIICSVIRMMVMITMVWPKRCGVHKYLFLWYHARNLTQLT